MKKKTKNPIYKKYLFPDYYYDNIYKVTPELLNRLGIQGLILDIDNTLVTYDDPVPTSQVEEWIKLITETGIKISFVSNNNAQRVKLFNSKLEFYASSDSGKPFKRELVNAMNAMCTSADSTMIIGDQIFTDIFAGKRIGLKAILVDPIKDKTTWFFKFKRMLEKPIKHRKKKDI